MKKYIKNKNKGFINLALVALIAVAFLGGYVFTNRTSPTLIDQYVKDSLVDKNILGATLPVAGTTYNLSASGISSSATSVTLASLTLSQTGQELLDSDFSDTFYLTIDPGNRTRQEIVACTTVTQSTGSTAILSGCSRGMSPITPYNASSTLQFSHSGGAQVIFSDPPQLFNSYPAKDNSEYISGTNWGFLNPPYFVNSATTTSQAASVAYVNSTAFGSTFVLKALGGTGVTGFGAGAFLYDSGSGTAYSGTTSPTVSSLIATSSVLTNYFAGPVTANSTLGVTGITTLTGALNANSTNNTIASSTQYTINVGAINATSSVKLNGIPFGYRSLGAISSKVTFTSNSSTTLASITVPANIISAGNSLKIDTTYSGTSAAVCDVSVQYGSGTATSTYGFGQTKSGNSIALAIGNISTTIFATSTIGQIGTSLSAGVTNNSPTEMFGVATSLFQGQVLSFYMNNKGTTPTTAQSYISVIGLAETATCSLEGFSVGLVSQ